MTFKESSLLCEPCTYSRLRRNLGHQRAIAIGLAHIQRSGKCDAVVVMDADGEDTPEGVAQLLHAYTESHGSRAIFAERSRRTESVSFRCFYHLYKILHRSLTGFSVRVGNFSILPARYLNTLVVLSELGITTRRLYFEQSSLYNDPDSAWNTDRRNFQDEFRRFGFPRAQCHLGIRRHCRRAPYDWSFSRFRIGWIRYCARHHDPVLYRPGITWVLLMQAARSPLS